MTTVVALVPAFSSIAAFSWPLGVLSAGLAYRFAMRGHSARAHTTEPVRIPTAWREPDLD